MENTIGLKIRKVRELKNISQEYVAKQLGISQPTYSDIENCKTQVTEARLQQIANILQIDVEVIKNFNDTVIFNSCVQSGYINTNNINPIEKVDDLYKKLLVEKEEKEKLYKQLLEEREA